MLLMNIVNRMPGLQSFGSGLLRRRCQAADAFIEFPPQRQLYVQTNPWLTPHVMPLAQ